MASRKAIPVPKNPSPNNAALLAALDLAPVTKATAKARHVEATDHATTPSPPTPEVEEGPDPTPPSSSPPSTATSSDPPAPAAIPSPPIRTGLGHASPVAALVANLNGTATTVTPMPRTWAPHLVIVARAGTGKTTTIVGGVQVVRGIKPAITPSPQQQAIWDVMEQGKAQYRSIALAAFNTSIARVLKERVPPGVDAMTMSSMGYRAVRRAFKLLDGKAAVAEHDGRKKNLFCELIGKDIREIRQDKDMVQRMKSVISLVKLCKMNLTAPDLEGKWETPLDTLVKHYDLELGHGADRDFVFEWVPPLLERCKDVDRDRYVDFDDMLWLPVVLKLRVWEYDMLLVDEAQDMNRCQHELAFMAGRRLVLCGDDLQAIYGFAGADSDSLPRMYERLSKEPNGCVKRPLTVTRRCGKAIVENAKRWAPDFEAHPDNPPGHVTSALFPIQRKGKNESEVLPYEQTYLPMVEDGDMILCRANAPLVGQCLQFIKRGRKATIQGRDIGDQLVDLVEGLGAAHVLDLIAKLADWHAAAVSKEMAERNPSESRIEQLGDRYDCIRTFCEDAKPEDPVAVVVAKINEVFTENKDNPGILLSSGHRAKGLEADTVFVLDGFGRPLDKIKNQWELDQEANIQYVMATRPKHTLVYVTGGR